MRKTFFFPRMSKRRNISLGLKLVGYTGLLKIAQKAGLQQWVEGSGMRIRVLNNHVPVFICKNKVDRKFDGHHGVGREVPASSPD